MDALQAILTRRSVREYTDQPVSDETVTELLRAAMAAPSAGNQQPWEFVVVRDRSILRQTAAVSRYARMVANAPVAVVICGNRDRERHGGFWVQDCSAATENLLVAARASGLGAVWLGMYPLEERVAGLRALFGLPDHVVPLGVVSIGYPAEDPGPVDRFDPERIHVDHW
jgi:nitroreductase